MTWTDHLCDVCQKNEPIGVASTSIPFSCAYCGECAARGADPEWIFHYLLEDVGNGDPSQIRQGLVTYKDGAYISFHDWAKLIQAKP